MIRVGIAAKLYPFPTPTLCLVVDRIDVEVCPALLMVFCVDERSQMRRRGEVAFQRFAVLAIACGDDRDEPLVRIVRGRAKCLGDHVRHIVAIAIDSFDEVASPIDLLLGNIRNIFQFLRERRRGKQQQEHNLPIAGS